MGEVVARSLMSVATALWVACGAGVDAPGADGDIWVREYDRRPGGPQEWLIFDADGRFTCRADLPFAESWDVYELGPDYVLGLETDELDVEHVRRYRLSHP